MKTNNPSPVPGSGGLAAMPEEERKELIRKALRASSTDDRFERSEQRIAELEEERQLFNKVLQEALGFKIDLLKEGSVTVQRAARRRLDSGSETPESEETAPLDEAPPLPDVYADLPALLREAARTFEQRHERDVFITAALPALAACMPRVHGYYGHVPEPLRPHLYTAAVAGAAGGKGPLKWGKRLADRVNRRILERSEAEIERWKQERELAEKRDERFDRPEPPKKSLLLPANTSAASFHGGLKDRDEHALVVETEIDTLTNALGQEWGKFDDTLRKAWHHEQTAYRRKGEGNVTLETPRLSVVLSGTPAQFSRLMVSSESGLYSRFALYYSQVAPVWISQKPTRSALNAIERFEAYAERVLGMWEALAGRDEPLRFRMTDEQWSRHDEAFSYALRKAALSKHGQYADVLKRSGIIAFRIAMILTVLRAHESGADLSLAGEVEAEDLDVETGIKMARTYADHAIRYAAARLETAEPPDPSSYRISVMLSAVGPRFSSGDAYEAAQAAGIEVSKRTLRSDLKKASKRGLIQLVSKNGRWRKTEQPVPEPASATSAVSGPTESSRKKPSFDEGNVQSETPETAEPRSTERSALNDKNNGHSASGSGVEVIWDDE